jgi:YHS domain-containing protein
MKTITIDPVCGMDVEENSPHRAEHDGELYLFCSDGCRQKFERDPQRWLKKSDSDERPSPPPARGAGSEKVRQKGRGTKWTDYIPLMVIIALTLLAASAKQVAYPGAWNGMTWMHDFMGFFLVVFSMFKLFNMEGFADGFQMYDLLAKPVRPYAYVYPFIELGLGLGYLAHWQPTAIYITTIVVTVFGSLGVLNALRKGMDLDCACMGTVLSVPLSTIALLEDLGMAAMAGAMLLMAR